MRRAIIFASLLCLFFCPVRVSGQVIADGEDSGEELHRLVEAAIGGRPLAGQRICLADCNNSRIAAQWRIWGDSFGCPTSFAIPNSSRVDFNGFVEKKFEEALDLESEIKPWFVSR